MIIPFIMVNSEVGNNKFKRPLKQLIFNYIVCCRIDMNDVIKVADFGLTEDMYSYNYFRPKGSAEGKNEEKLPIKWMAPESIETNLFNENTDVVSNSYIIFM